MKAFILEIDEPKITGYIYKLVSSETDLIYIGSTFKTINQRFTQHKKDYKKYLKGKHSYTTAVEVLKYVDCKPELIEKVECKNKYELREYERNYIKNNVCFNKNIPNQRLEEKKQYVKNFKNRIIKCDCGAEIKYFNKPNHLKTHNKQ